MFLGLYRVRDIPGWCVYIWQPLLLAHCRHVAHYLMDSIRERKSKIPPKPIYTNLNGSDISSKYHKTSFPFANSCLCENDARKQFSLPQKKTTKGRMKNNTFTTYLQSKKKVKCVIWPAHLSDHSWRTPCALNPSLSPFDKMWNYGTYTCPMFW